MPSTTARVACLVPITLGIIAAFGVNKKGAFASMLMITTVQTASIWNVGIKTAAAQNMVAIGFIEKTLQQDHHLAGMVDRRRRRSRVLMSIALYFVMTRMMPPEVEGSAGRPRGDPQVAGRARADEGSEMKLLAHLAHAARLLGDRRRAAQVRHVIDHTIAAVALMFLPGIGIMTWKEAQPKIPWGTIVLFGIGISLGTALLQTKGAVWLADIVVAAVRPASMRPRCSSSA